MIGFQHLADAFAPREIDKVQSSCRCGPRVSVHSIHAYRQNQVAGCNGGGGKAARMRKWVLSVDTFRAGHVSELLENTFVTAVASTI